MTIPKILRSALSEIIKIQGLDDLSQFYRPHFFDEIPFFSRASDVSFLERLGRAEAEKILIGFSLDYLDSLTGFEVPTDPFFAAVTITDLGTRDVIVPNIFVCHGLVAERLQGRLILDEPTSRFAVKIKGIVQSLDHHGLDLLQDHRTIPRHPRIFLGQSSPPTPLNLRITACRTQTPVTNGR